MADADHVSNSSNNRRVRIYLSCICFYCFDCSCYSLTRCLCLFPPTVLYHQQRYQHLCHHDVLPPSATGTPQLLQPERDPTMAASTGTRSDNGGNGNRDTQTTAQQSPADHGWQQSFSIINNGNTSSIKIMTITTSSLQVQQEHHSSSNWNAIRQ